MQCLSDGANDSKAILIGPVAIGNGGAGGIGSNWRTFRDLRPLQAHGLARSSCCRTPINDISRSSRLSLNADPLAEASRPWEIVPGVEFGHWVRMVMQMPIASQSGHLVPVIRVLCAFVHEHIQRTGFEKSLTSY